MMILEAAVGWEKRRLAVFFQSIQAAAERDPDLAAKVNEALESKPRIQLATEEEIDFLNDNPGDEPHGPHG